MRDNEYSDPHYDQNCTEACRYEPCIRLMLIVCRLPFEKPLNRTGTNGPTFEMGGMLIENMGNIKSNVKSLSSKYLQINTPRKKPFDAGSQV
ncbi:hypothetical protein TNCT_471141 [Trichonephila clavata]|uniref:Uncharacterized protein n=1 Tax=Trichonephila clavata TaxID=2740835 RepID=A0A8X6HD49_TRICU|nr:hypothetical protein TNCT_471141 [Trichonephila clavata]